MPQTDPDKVAREALRLIGPDPQNWVPDRDDVDHNVLVVGGGQSGSAFAFALRRAGIGKVSAIDAAPDGARAGVWLTSARMHKLRTPKNLPGPELGLPALGFQAWYEARYGAAAYEALDRIPRCKCLTEKAFFALMRGFPAAAGDSRKGGVARRRAARACPARAGARKHLPTSCPRGPEPFPQHDREQR